MKDEINLILDKLQKENNILKENAIHNDKVVDKARWNEMLYKSRNEKAIKYIEQEAVFYDSYDGEDIMLEKLCKRYYKELLNILNGGDDNE